MRYMGASIRVSRVPCALYGGFAGDSQRECGIVSGMRSFNSHKN
jgi:hypothetical protein